MTTGKTAFEVEASINEIIRKDGDHQRELARLEREVIEAAKQFKTAWRARIQDRISSRHPSDAIDGLATEARIRLCDQVDALESFEAKHK